MATGVPKMTPPNCVNCNKAPIKPYKIKNRILSRLKGIIFLIAIIGNVSRKRNNSEYNDISKRENPRFEKNCPPGIIRPKNIAEMIMVQ